MTVAPQTRCLKCETRLVVLKNFDGNFDGQMPTFDDPYRTPNAVTGGGGLVFEILVDIFGEIFKSILTMGRRRKVQKLKTEILPQFPGSVICPKCLSVSRKS